MDGSDGNRPVPGELGPSVAPAEGGLLHAMRLALAAQADALGDTVLECDAQGRLTGWASSGALALGAGHIPAGADPAALLPGPLGAACAALLAGRAASGATVALADGAEHVQITEIALPGQARRYLSLRPMTQMVALQERLTRREGLLKDLFDLSPVGVLLLNYKTAEVLEVNQAILRIGAWSRQDVIGQHLEKILPLDQWASLGDGIAELKETGQCGPLEVKLRRPDGSLFEAVLRGLKVGPKGNRRVWVLVEDVSSARAHLRDLHMARDEALRRREELQLAVEALPHGFIMLDAMDRVTLLNQQMHKIYPDLSQMMTIGRSYEEILRHAVASGAVLHNHPNDQDYIDTLMAQRKGDYFEHLVQTARGRSVRCVERRMPDGGRVGLRMDVTDELAAQQHLSQVIEGARVGTWELDLQTLVMQVNDRWADMLGLRLADVSPIDSEILMHLVHPDDRDRVVLALSRVVRQQQDTVDLVFRMRHVQGHWVWIETRGKVSRKRQDGQFLTMAGVHIDVSAMKMAELRLAGIIHGAEAGIWEYDRPANLNRVNSRWAEMLGYTLPELQPLTTERWQAMLHPEDLTRVLAMEAASFAKGIWIYSYELRVRHKLGHWVWIQSRGQVTDWDAEGQPVAMSGVHLDISARKRLEMALKAERDFLATLMETSVSGILAVDDETRIIFANREVEAIFGVSSSALLGQFCDPAVLGINDSDGNPIACDQMPCRLAIRTGQIQRDIRLRLASPGGCEKVVSVNAAPLPEQDGRASVVCTITDITKAAEAEDRLREATLRAEATSRAKSQFLANVSHELRTPLNGILGMADLMLAERPDEVQMGMLRTIRESGAHLLSVVNDILDLAKVESGKLTLDCGPMALTDLAARVDAMHRVTAMAKGVRLVVSLQEGLQPMRHGDDKRVLQVLHNLVGNAIKFTHQGEVSLTFAASGKDQVAITVTDSGIGMSPEQSASVWEEFTQADGSITRRFGGTGLGLPIVRRLVDLMQGEITLDSTEGVGTRVSLILPLPVTETRDPPQPPLYDLLTVTAQFPGLRALVAEDNATNRVILRAMLARLGIQAIMVEDGDEVVRTWASQAPDLMLLDICMPRKDGVSALQEVQQLAAALGRAVPPAIAVTANAMTNHVEDYLRAGFAAVVSKPVSLEDLARVITKLCPTATRTPQESVVPAQ